MANTNTAAVNGNLGTVGKVINHAATYAPGSFEVFVTFMMLGLQFEAHRFVRTDGACACDKVYLYIRHEGSLVPGCTDYVKTIDPSSANLSRVDIRALHLLAVACTEIPADTAERYAAIELA